MSGAYSFFDVNASIDGPGGNFTLKGGNAEEGISIEPSGDINTMTGGADGAVMHSLSAQTSGTVTVRLLKTSPINAQLMTMAKFQRASAARHGQNTIVVRDSTRGDIVTCTQVAFKKIPALTYAKEGGLVEWAFDAGSIDQNLGTGTPVAPAV